MKKSLIGVFICLQLCTALHVLVQPQTVFAKNDEKELFLVAQKAFQDGFYDVAIRYIDQLLTEHPLTEKRIQAKLLLGQCYFFQSQYLKAYDVFNGLLEFNEFKDATLFWLGETYLKGADYKQAEEQYKKLIKLYPDSSYAPQATYSLGWNYFEREKYQLAQKTFEKLIKNFPNHQLSEDAAFKLGETLFNLHQFEAAIESFNQYLFDYAQSRRQAEAYFYLGESAYYLKNYLNAVTYYAKSDELAYNNRLSLMAKISLGWCYLKIGKHNLSQQYFDQARDFGEKKDMLNDDVFLGQANLYTETKEYEKALEAYDQLILTFPDSKRIIDARLGKANIHYLLKQYEESASAYRTLISQTDPILDQAQTKLEKDALQEIIEKAYFGLAWSYLKNGQIDQSIKSFEAIKNRSNNNTVKISALTQIGDAYQDIGQLSKAIEVYDSILNTYPDSVYIDYVQYRQGIALLKMDNLDGATLAFQSLKSNFPTSKYVGDIHYYLAVAYFKKEDWGAALAEVKMFVTQPMTGKDDFLAEAYYIMALSEFNLQQYHEALTTLKSVIKNFPEQNDIVRKAEVNLAKVYGKKGDDREAIKLFKLLIAKYPKTQIAQEAMNWLAKFYLERHEYENAILYYTRITEEFPGSENIDAVFYELGQAYRAKGEFSAAIGVLKKIEQEPQPDIYAKSRLTIAEIFSQEMDAEQALTTYEQIIATSPEYQRDAYVNIAKIHKKNLRFQESLEAYKKAKKAEQGLSRIKDVELQFYIADDYELLNEKEKAVDEFLRIVYLYPDETHWIVKGYLHVARIFEHKEQWEEAKIIYEKISAFDVDEAKFAKERLDWIVENENQYLQLDKDTNNQLESLNN